MTAASMAALLLVAGCSADGDGDADDDDASSTTTTSPPSGPLTTKEVFERTRKSAVQISGNQGDATVGGTGVIVDADEGLVLTNHHVVEGVTGLQAIVEDEEEVRARVVASAPCDDLALVELIGADDLDLQQAKFGNSDLVENEDEVLVLGYPASFEVGEQELISTSGRVQSPDVAAEPSPGGPRLPSMIQHSATVNPGNSGGPLFNDRAELIGINTLGYLDAELGVENQYYSISINHVRRLLPDLKAGVSTTDVGWNIAPFSQVPLSEVFEETGYGTAEEGVAADQLLIEEGVDGIFVFGVEEGSAAEDAALEGGDLIETIDGSAVTTVADVCEALTAADPGDTLALAGRYLTSGGPDQEFAEPWRTQLTLPE